LANIHFTDMATKDERNAFSAMILHRAEKHACYAMEAFVEYCDETDLEIETAASLVNDVLKSKLEEEAQLLNYLPRSAKLPI
jgi:Phage late-transcription coactivator